LHRFVGYCESAERLRIDIFKDCFHNDEAKAYQIKGLQTMAVGGQKLECHRGNGAAKGQIEHAQLLAPDRNGLHGVVRQKAAVRENEHDKPARDLGVPEQSKPFVVDAGAPLEIEDAEVPV